MRKFLRIELDKPIGVVDQTTAETEVQKDLKERILDEYRKVKKPEITAQSKRMKEEIKT